jgi:hypothetical protein
MRAKAKSNPNLVLAGPTWPLTQYPSAKREWSMGRKVRELKDAGFSAFGAGVAAPGAVEASKAEGMPILVYVDVVSVKETRSRLDLVADIGPPMINVQLGDHDTPTSRAVRIAVAVMRESRKLGLENTHIEVHRDTATETPEKSFAIIDGYKKATGEDLSICWDHSHFSVVKHLRPNNYVERLIVRKRLIQVSRQFHLRPFNGHHCQVPVTNGKGGLSPEFRDWIVFVDALFDCWLSGPRPGNELWVVPELGPPMSGYGLSCFPDVFGDLKVCRREILKSWNRALKRTK